MMVLCGFSGHGRCRRAGCLRGGAGVRHTVSPGEVNNPAGIIAPPPTPVNPARAQQRSYIYYIPYAVAIPAGDAEGFVILTTAVRALQRRHHTRTRSLYI